jgi:hydroxymethylbilane synthase
MNRLGIASWPQVTMRPLSFAEMVPAVGQGAIAIQCRAAEAAKFARVFDAATMRTVTLERAFQNALGGGCHTAFAAHATGDRLHLFHENTGPHSCALGDADFTDPAACASRILRELNLLP